MSNSGVKNKCKQVRLRLSNIFLSRLDTSNGWVANHIKKCEKCQKRIIGLGNVDFAFSLLKSQPHKIDLLMRANTQAINVLKHSLRNAPKAQKLKMARPQPKWHRRNSRQIQALLSAAACIAVVVLLKFGAFSSADTVEKHGKNIMRNYYAKHLGQETADELFSA